MSRTLYEGEARHIFQAELLVMRTPLLPVDELEDWSRDLEAPEIPSGGPEVFSEVVERDRRLLRRRLREKVGRPEIREALYVASPSLTRALDGWWRNPDSKRGRRAEHSLVRYLQRMATRATPFGLFAATGASRGDIWCQKPCLRLAPRSEYRRRTRLDMDYLFALTEALVRDPELRGTLAVRPNSSAYSKGGRLRYAEARPDGAGRSYHLVAVEESPFLRAALDEAAGGADPQRVATAVARADPEGEATVGEALEFVGRLLDNQILVPDLPLHVTGSSTVGSLIEGLDRYPEGCGPARHLERARARLGDLDRAGLGNSPEHYRAVTEELETVLPTPGHASHLLEVDLFEPTEEAGLTEAVGLELAEGLDSLRRIARSRGESALDRFRRAFAERYGEGNRVRLFEALDEELGVGFSFSGASAQVDDAPLLAGLGIRPPGSTGGGGSWTESDAYLLQRVHETLAAGEQELELTDADLERLGTDDPPPLPDAYHVLAKVAAASAEAVVSGDFRVLLRGAGGPSGARLLGRFCHLDRELEASVRDHLRAEEAGRPEAVFAEIVHLPQGRIGNILARPQLRKHEIPFLGRASVDPEHQIPVQDLTVSVVRGRIFLRSERLNREVIPRLTSAHNFAARNLGVYKFLCALQSEGSIGWLSWDWGPLRPLPRLPRVTRGRTILARARWSVSERESEELSGLDGSRLLARLRRWRSERGLPRRCQLQEGDNELWVDFENVLSAEAFADQIRSRSGATLVELVPDADELWAHGPEGRFHHEILIPVARAPSDSPTRGHPAPLPVPERFPPDSEWLYIKLFTGIATADEVLRRVVTPTVQESVRDGIVDRWFFLRYGSPDWHLRVRFHGRPAALRERVLPALKRRAAQYLEDGRIWRLQLDTYVRETSRYGGPGGIELAEELFRSDSDAVLALLSMLEGEQGRDLRWRLALRGSDQLLDDLGHDLETKLRIALRLRESFAHEFRPSLELKRRVGDRYREEREAVEALLDRAADERSPLKPALDILHRRSQASVPAIEELIRREESGRLNPALEQIAPSLIHLHVNRLIRSDGRAHELVLYEFLYRAYRARAARRAAKEHASRH